MAGVAVVTMALTRECSAAGSSSTLQLESASREPGAGANAYQIVCLLNYRELEAGLICIRT